jgi:hypothetical protein
MLEKQLNETRVRKQMEISELDGRLAQDYEKKLEESLSVSSWAGYIHTKNGNFGTYIFSGNFFGIYFSWPVFFGIFPVLVSYQKQS